MPTSRVATRETGALRARLIAAASKVFLEEGYEHLSMRRVAQEAGCSQMAMYRHFANKEALTQHICGELYSRFTVKMQREINSAGSAWEKVRIFVAALIQFAASYPDHYSLIFLTRHTNPQVIDEREKLGQEFLKGVQDIVRELLPEGTPAAIVNMRLRQMLTCLHGAAALLIAHPRVYGLTKQGAIRDTEETFRKLLDIAED